MRYALGLLCIMCNPKYAKTRLYARIDQQLDGRHRRGIEGCGRFVEQQHSWLHHQRAREREPQPLPRRQPRDWPRSCLLGKAQVSDECKRRCPLAKCSPTVSAHQPGSAGT